MEKACWFDELPCAITVCDEQGTILEMNEKAMKTFEKDGGAGLVGRNLLDCHPEPARSKLKKMLQEQRKNTYTIEKNGVKKLIHQTPWYRDGVYRGLVEFSIEIPFERPNFIRK